LSDPHYTESNNEGVEDHIKGVIFDQLKAIALGVRESIGLDCEVVIHDFDDLEHSIICIEGNVTHRQIGGSLTNLGLAKLRKGETDDLYNYTTSTEDGRILKSSSTFLRDRNGRVFGAFCINADITSLLAFEHTLRALCHRDDADNVTEFLSDNISEILTTMMSETTYEIGKPISLMSKEDKVSLVSLLDEKGAFQVKKAVPFVAQQLGVSRYTVYNYLNEAREHQNQA